MYTYISTIRSLGRDAGLRNGHILLCLLIALIACWQLPDPAAACGPCFGYFCGECADCDTVEHQCIPNYHSCCPCSTNPLHQVDVCVYPDMTWIGDVVRVHVVGWSDVFPTCYELELSDESRFVISDIDCPLDYPQEAMQLPLSPPLETGSSPFLCVVPTPGSEQQGSIYLPGSYDLYVQPMWPKFQRVSLYDSQFGLFTYAFRYFAVAHLELKGPYAIGNTGCTLGSCGCINGLDSEPCEHPDDFPCQPDDPAIFYIGVNDDFDEGKETEDAEDESILDNTLQPRLDDLAQMCWSMGTSTVYEAYWAGDNDVMCGDSFAERVSAEMTVSPSEIVRLWVWHNDQYEQLPLGQNIIPDYGTDTLFYAEGLKPGTVTIALEGKIDNDSDLRRIDKIRLSPVKIDVDVDSDNTNTTAPYGPDALPATPPAANVEDRIEQKEGEPGRFVLVNDDDDDLDGKLDYDPTDTGPIQDEDDLVEIKITAPDFTPENPNWVKWSLSVPLHIDIWENPDKTGLHLSSGEHEFAWTEHPLPKTWYIQGLYPAGPLQITAKLLIDLDGAGPQTWYTPVHQDTVQVTVYSVKFAGLWETTNPANCVFNPTWKDDPADNCKEVDPRPVVGNYGTWRQMLYIAEIKPEQAAPFYCADLDLDVQPVALRGLFRCAVYDPASVKLCDTVLPSSTLFPAMLVFSDPAVASPAVTNFSVKAGYDANANGVLDNNEASPIVVFYAPPGAPDANQPRYATIKGINDAQCIAADDSIYGGFNPSGLPGPIIFAIFPHARSFLSMFYFGNLSWVHTLVTPTSSIPVSWNAFTNNTQFTEWLSHNCGTSFDFFGQATTTWKYTWDTTSAVSQFFANVTPFRLADQMTDPGLPPWIPPSTYYVMSETCSKLKAYYDNHVKAEEIAALSGSEPGTTHVSRWCTFPNEDSDLFISTNGPGNPPPPLWVAPVTQDIGHAADGYSGGFRNALLAICSGPEAEADHDAALSFGRGRVVDPRYSFTTRKVDNSGNYHVDSVRFICSLGDLYDFNLECILPASDGAAVQIGYGNGGNGRSHGIIFFDVIQVDSTYANPFDEGTQ